MFGLQLEMLRAHFNANPTDKGQKRRQKQG